MPAKIWHQRINNRKKYGIGRMNTTTKKKTTTRESIYFHLVIFKIKIRPLTALRSAIPYLGLDLLSRQSLSSESPRIKI